jgi:hypothetical protein
MRRSQGRDFNPQSAALQAARLTFAYLDECYVSSKFRRSSVGSLRSRSSASSREFSPRGRRMWSATASRMRRRSSVMLNFMCLSIVFVPRVGIEPTSHVFQTCAKTTSATPAFIVDFAGFEPVVCSKWEHSLPRLRPIELTARFELACAPVRKECIPICHASKIVSEVGLEPTSSSLRRRVSAADLLTDCT